MKVIAKHGVGTDNVDKVAVTELGIQMTNGLLCNYKAVAENRVGIVLACAIPVVYMNRRVKKEDWILCDSVECFEVGGKVLGIVGFGRVGETRSAQGPADENYRHRSFPEKGRRYFLN